MKHLHSLGNIAAALLLAAGLLTACTQDDLSSPIGGVEGALPEGKYPLQIVSITLTAEVDGQPWTRVGESEDRQSSHWNNGDKIRVQIANGTPGTYTYQDGSLTVADGDAPAYWASKADGQSIRAWHTSSGSETVELGNQTNSLAYVLTALSIANFVTQVSLSFAHALAKVRVKLMGEKAEDVNEVKIKTYTSCILGANGTLTEGETENFIPMEETTYDGATCWEANVMPGQIIGEVKVNDKEISLSASLTPLAAKVNTITINVGKAAMNPDELPNEINDDGEYTISGTGTKGITITGGSPTVRFKEVTLTSETAVSITGGNPKLIFEGTNSLKSTGDGKGAISLSGGASVEISGSGTLSLKANTADYNVAGWYEGAILGSAGGETCGDISITGVMLSIEANSYNAAIGSGEKDSSCGDIIITDASVHITGCNGGAGIGTSIAHQGISSCGDIRIKNSDITIEYGNMSAWQGAAIGCAAGGASGGLPASYSNTVKGIYITLKSGQSKSDFLGMLTTTSATGADQVGQGYCETDGKKYGTISNGVHWYNADGSEMSEP